MLCFELQNVLDLLLEADEAVAGQFANLAILTHCRDQLTQKVASSKSRVSLCTITGVHTCTYRSSKGTAVRVLYALSYSPNDKLARKTFVHRSFVERSP